MEIKIMNVENGNFIVCDECGGKMLAHIMDRDEQGNMYCRDCGLVYDANHEMGSGFEGLEVYMKRNGLNDQIEKAAMYNFTLGLAEARLFVSKL